MWCNGSLLEWIAYQYTAERVSVQVAPLPWLGGSDAMADWHAGKYRIRISPEAIAGKGRYDPAAVFLHELGHIALRHVGQYEITDEFRSSLEGKPAAEISEAAKARIAEQEGRAWSWAEDRLDNLRAWLAGQGVTFGQAATDPAVDWKWGEE